MFEITPGTDWNLDVLIRQIFVGIGDAVPGFLIAFLISRKIEGKPEKPTKHRLDYRLMLLIAVCLFVIRMIGYTSGIVLNSMDDYRIPVIAWTLLFSILAGISVGILHPFYRKGTHFSVIRFLLSFGCNWLCFNGFIGLIWKGFWAVIFIRVAADLLAVLLAIGIYQKLPKKSFT